MNSNLDSKDARIGILVEKLGSKLNNFQVVDKQGELIGQVKELVLDLNRQLNLVVTRTNTDSPQQFCLISKLIERIDPANKLVVVSIYSSQIEQLPKHTTTDTATDAVDFEHSSDQVRATKEEQPLAEMSSSMNSSDLPVSRNPLEEEVLEEEVIRLLAERLVINRNQRKVGEVVVRKVIETRTLQVPVRYEKLVVEQVNPEYKQLAEIDLRVEDNLATLPETQVNGFNSSKDTDLNNQRVVSGTFNSPQVASLILQAIAKERQHGCQQVRVKILVEDAVRQQTYQEWMDRCSN